MQSPILTLAPCVLLAVLGAYLKIVPSAGHSLGMSINPALKDPAWPVFVA
jgi:hypothetical protein